jgi:hypothetical protein
MTIDPGIRDVLQTRHEKLECAALVHAEQFPEGLHDASPPPGVARQVVPLAYHPVLQGSYQHIGYGKPELYPCTFPHGVEKVRKCRVFAGSNEAMVLSRQGEH